MLLENHMEITVVAGGAKGADSLAEMYAKSKSYPLRVFPAQWDMYGKRAGYIRNEEMHKFVSQQEKRGVVAFWDGKSPGTEHSFRLAKIYGNPIRVFDYIQGKFVHPR
jgi:hypothetical protein